MRFFMKNDENIQQNQFFTDILLRDNIYDMRLGKY